MLQKACCPNFFTAKFVKKGSKRKSLSYAFVGGSGGEGGGESLLTGDY